MTQESVILACLNCNGKNRIPVVRLDESPKCAKCGYFLPVENLSLPVCVTDNSFFTEVLSSPIPVLVDCWAPWCGPCKSIGPIIDSLAVQFRARVKIAKLNLDENPTTGSAYSITSVPTFLLIKNGKVVDKLVGAIPKEQMVAAIERIL